MQKNSKKRKKIHKTREANEKVKKKKKKYERKNKNEKKERKRKRPEKEKEDDRQKNWPPSSALLPNPLAGPA